MKFSGKFKGCVRDTTVNSKGVIETEYKATMKIKNVNCSNKTAFLIEICDKDGEIYNLAFLEDLEGSEPILRSVSETGKGITSTYWKDSHLIHQTSTATVGCDGQTTWKVKYYNMKLC